MTTGLVGRTGFVGGTIARQRPINRGYHRPNVAQIRGQHFDLLWLAGAPGQKWAANADPNGDLDALRELVEHLRHVRVTSAVLISTVDIYPVPVGVDEHTRVSVSEHPNGYGRNRLWLEEKVRVLFENVLVVRLPGLFGAGLRKNLVFDLLHEREEFAHRDSTFQFYDMRRLCNDVDSARAAGLSTVNLAVEPIAASTLAWQVFGRVLECEQGVPARYDMRTVHAGLYGRPGQPYVQSSAGCLDEIASFVAQERAS